ncbi:hypothetical protein KOI35_10800 [Actinoplanes bogorensis]|uniref:DUF2029 domain-containing protein n=1 Tax=Paractinoplanes bogorensis TaxID=1610840 RepID=A0ABS5YKM4_9ACTN|nr:hypothetical protein [Actinoplanes bogorensis]MBU2663977.1 hypothetical protein [Actinoplanes bogorensis]
MHRLTRWALPATAVVVTAAVLAPLAAPGYVLSYDMLFVPHQPLRADLIVPSATLPRAVPQDALVSLASLVAPGWLIQRVALVAILMLAAWGAGRLVPTERVGPRLVAAVAYAWTPFLAERLLLGQWGLLLAYGSLPWILGTLKKEWWKLLVACLPAAVTPTGGLIAFATVLVLAPRKAVIPALLNLPWLLATAFSQADGRSDPGGVAAFAARGTDWTGPIGALLGTGGIWNAQTTLPSRSSPLVPLGTLLLLALAVTGWRPLRDRWPDGTAIRLLILAGGGFLLAALAVVPGGRGLLEWAVTTLPGAGVLRDGAKFLIPYALIVALCAALGAERLHSRAILAGALVLPLVVMPDLAFGAGGRLRPVSYPADFAVVARTIEASPGEVVSLPFVGYHTYRWNRGRTVIDPLPRFVDADVVRDDRLLVGGQVIAGESTRAAEIRRVLAAGQPLAQLGMRWVVVQRVEGEPPVPPAALAGLTMVHAGSDLQLYENGSSQRSY